ncbi:PLDc N-terminal domain-containing protein [Pseudoalteromonas sp. MMG010]|uniref:PLDc N-terminal domain-containing protein n=1 Tax=Pseudoalteromonas sp. MMG010 TaxID=2822685 RepID=UPI001B3A48E8|nr:PLDc N-terminal domain-containing protein [Pseudoalteromonas sp. MMG010]MBQ4834425.1 PLDc N-terminal domain-containing protein [Pseudoalteromonas sp. MMG010]
MGEIIFLIVVLSAYIFPIMIVLNSKRTQGHEKNGWLMGIIIFSWVGLILYLSIVPKQGHKKKNADKKTKR